MKNKVKLKKCLFLCLITTTLFLVVFLSYQWAEYQSYTLTYNQTLLMFLQKIQENHPDINEAEFVEILNIEDTTKIPFVQNKSWESFATQYGIDITGDSMILANQNKFLIAILINSVLVLIFAMLLTCIFLKYNQNKEEELKQITHYLEEINQRNYKLDIDSNSEDELSILKNELYKTTVMLKETAEHSLQAKNSLKDSLSDISHQIKTPLTSILIMLDNLIDNPDMELQVRQKFVHNIKREVQNINFLVQSLLKLSKLDAEAVVFFKEQVHVQNIVDAAVQNVATLCDLKNITIELSGESGDVCCDFRWQVEAITNVLKNCVEYAPENSKVLIQMHTNPVYSGISIRDFGNGMDEEEQIRIFDRFYKGKNASHDSLGIGLALAKAIIEGNHGHISVRSGHTGTTFIIKLYSQM